MDAHTLDLLEFDKVRALVAARAACSLGKDAARQLEPSRDLDEIRQRQALTTEMAEALASGLTPPFGGLHDIRALVRRAQLGAMLDGDELAETAETLRAIGNLDRWLGRVSDQFPRLGALKPRIGEFSGVVVAIDGCLDERGKVLDSASRRLSAVRHEIGQVERRIQATLQQMLRSSELKRILRYPSFTMVGHHYVLPVAKEHRGELQGAVHRTSASNETVFVEPLAIAEQSAQLSFLRVKEAKEIRRIFRWLSAQVGQVAASLLESLDALAELDLIYAKGRYSLDYALSVPDVNDQGILALRGARHPLLEALFRNEPAFPRESTGDESPPPPVSEPRTVVPIDVHLGFSFQLLIVTGPNTGGKTVALKTTGLIAVMAQAGLHIPAHQGSQLPAFDAVLADIGDEQSLEQSLSTFSSHVRRVSDIFARASARSLILLDELGAGTDPADGAALGRAILDELDSIGCRAIVTTHIGDLKTYALTNPRAENAAVEFDLETLQPRFRLRIGDIGQSNALEIARRLELPEHIVARAADHLARQRSERLPELEALQKLRQEAEDARQAALAAQAEAELSREALRQRLSELQLQAERDARIVEARARLQPGDRVVVPRFGYDRPGRVVKLDPKKKTAIVAIGQMQWTVGIDELIPQSIREAEIAPGAKAPSGAPARGTPRLDDFEG